MVSNGDINTGYHIFVPIAPPTDLGVDFWLFQILPLTDVPPFSFELIFAIPP